jgi:xanthine dehydrogenase accessory factor
MTDSESQQPGQTPSDRPVVPEWLSQAESLLGSGQEFVTALVVGPDAHPLCGQRAVIAKRTDGALVGTGLPDKLIRSLTAAVENLWIAQGVARVTIPDAVEATSGDRSRTELEVFLSWCGPPDTVWIFGAGHIAQALAPCLFPLGFAVVVCDDRRDYADAERFDTRCRLLCDDFGRLAQRCAEGARRHWAVLVTRGHEHDEQILRALAEAPLRYIGMIGSKRRVTSVRKRLSGSGINAAFLESVHAPIGVAIGADSPAEIAVSIAAELIAVRRGHSERNRPRSGSLIQTADTSDLSPIWSDLSAASAAGRPAVLATVIARRGSAPRGIGAQMIVLADGSISGTVGGGCGEEAVRSEAKRLLVGGQRAHAITIDLTADPGGEQSDICGGQYTVFLETPSDSGSDRSGT